MFSCVVCGKEVILLSGFTSCGCGIAPVQKTIIHLSPQPEDYISFLKTQKLFPIKTSENALNYMRKAVNYLRNSKHGKIISSFSDDQAVWIAGLGDWNSLLSWLKGCPTSIKPQNLIIVKSIPDYITGFWIIGRKRVRKISWHPFGAAFLHFIYYHSPLTYPILLFQNLPTALKILNKNFSFNSLTPIIGHPELTPSGINLWLEKEIIAVIEEESASLLQKLKRCGITYISRSELTSWHGPTLVFQANQKKRAPQISQILISVARTPPVIVDAEKHIWRHAKTGQILGVVPFILKEVAIYDSGRIYLGRIVYQGREITAGFDNKSIAGNWIEFVCRRENIPFELDRKLRNAFVDVLLNLYEKEIKTTTSPIFGWKKEENLIFLPYVTFKNEEASQNYIYLSSYPFSWVPISSLTRLETLSPRYCSFLKNIKKIFESCFENDFAQIEVTCENVNHARNVLSRFWIVEKRSDHSFWPMIGKNIIFVEGSKRKVELDFEDFPSSIPPIFLTNCFLKLPNS